MQWVTLVMRVTLATASNAPFVHERRLDFSLGEEGGYDKKYLKVIETIVEFYQTGKN